MLISDYSRFVPMESKNLNKLYADNVDLLEMKLELEKAEERYKLTNNTVIENLRDVLITPDMGEEQDFGELFESFEVKSLPSIASSDDSLDEKMPDNTDFIFIAPRSEMIERQYGFDQRMQDDMTSLPEYLLQSTFSNDIQKLLNNRDDLYLFIKTILTMPRSNLRVCLTDQQVAILNLTLKMLRDTMSRNYNCYFFGFKRAIRCEKGKIKFKVMGSYEAKQQRDSKCNSNPKLQPCEEVINANNDYFWATCDMSNQDIKNIIDQDIDNYYFKQDGKLFTLLQEITPKFDIIQQDFEDEYGF
jgi:hypothetical protein